MGRGNVSTRNKYEEVLYIDYENFHLPVLDENGEETEETEFDNDHMQDTIDEFCSEMINHSSFEKVDKWLDRERHVILENGLYQIAITDNEWSYAILLLQRDDAPESLQCRHYKSYVRMMHIALFKQFYEIGVYGGPWTSGRIRREDSNV